MAPSKDMQAFQELLASCKNIIAVAGAGLSAASGIPTFRGAGGFWRKYNAMELATPEAFDETPSLVWQFYHYRRESALRASPNDAHRALSAFSLSAFRHQISPQSNFTLITQNVDGLSPRADLEISAKHPVETTASEKSALIEMHGRLFDVTCTDENCDQVDFSVNSPICDGLSGTEELVEQGTIDPIVDQMWFGEIPHRLDEIDALVTEADLCLVIGTSSVVQPAASYAAEVKQNGGKVAIFNMERTAGDREADYLFLGPCEELLPKALSLVVSEDGSVSVSKA